MFYLEKDKEIILFNEDKQLIINMINLHPEYKGLEIKETDRPIVDFQFADTPEYEEEQAQKERKRINLLSLTKREVFLAVYKDKGITPEQIRATITDTAALIEFDYANEYYRGNPLIGLLGAQLGYTSEELDYLFENKELPLKKSEEV